MNNVKSRLFKQYENKLFINESHFEDNCENFNLQEKASLRK